MIDKQKADLSTDVSIVGGGMVGASLALALSRQCPTMRISVFEVHPFSSTDKDVYQPSYDGRATAISYGSKKILQDLGLGSQITSQSGVISTIQVSDRGHSGSTVMGASQHGVEALGYVVENRWLGQQLMEAIACRPNITVQAPVEVTSAEFNASGVCLGLANTNEKISSRLLIIADGANSTLRKRCGILAESQNYNQCAVIAGVRASNPHDGIAYERFTDWGPMALLPLAAQDRYALVWTLPTEQAGEIADQNEDIFLSLLQERFGFRAGKFLDVSGIARYPLSLVRSKEQVRRRLVVLGNAAHSLHPVAGQGFNLSLRDADVLARHVSKAFLSDKDIGDLGLLQNYCAEREADQQAVIYGSDFLVKTFSSPSLVKAASRNLGLLAMDMLPSVRNELARYAMGL